MYRKCRKSVQKIYRNYIKSGGNVMLDYKKTEDMERMKAEAVKRLKWPKIPGLNEAFAKGIVMVSDGTNGDVKLRNLTIYEKYMVTNFEKIQHAIVYHTILTETKFGKMLSMLFVGKYEDEWFMDEENFKKSYTQVYVENLDYPDCSEIGTIGIECTENGIIRTY